MTRITKSVKLPQAAAVTTTKDEADNTLLDLYNSSDHTKAQSNNSAITMDNRQGHPAAIFGKYLFGRRFEI